MASHRQRKLILAIIGSDKTFERAQGPSGVVWQGKCLHCNSALLVSAAGDLLGKATLEHIVPRAHGGTDTLTNVGIACARCNHQKGSRIDCLPKSDPRRLAVSEKLSAKRQQRWRGPVARDCPENS